MRATASAMPTQTPPTSLMQARVPTNAPCRTCTRTHTTHTSAHAHTHTHTQTHTRTHARTLQPTAKYTRTRTCAHTLSRAHTQTHTKPLARSLARTRAHAPAHPARWTTCADELLQLRQQLAAQGVELQQLRQSNSALVAAAEATARRNRDTSTRRKQRATKSATKAHDGMAEVQQEWQEGARWAPPTQAH
jgi:hypothetical protein